MSAQDELERHWSAVQGWLGQVLVERGVERIAAEELTVPPGGDELFSLLRLKRHVEEGGWDVIVVDCAPTGETLRLLSFPEAARWWLGKLVGRETQLLAAARPLARAFLDLRLPDEEVMAEVQGLVANLVAMHDILRDRDAVSVRLVMTPDRMVVAEAMRTFTYLSLYGYLTDAVIVNRVFPDELDGHLLRRLARRAAARARARARRLRARAGAVRAVLRVRGARRRDARPARRRAVRRRATRPRVLHERARAGVRARGGRGHVRLAVPFAGKGDVSLKKVGDELVVRVDGRKRTVVLPPALAALKPAGGGARRRRAGGALCLSREQDALREVRERLDEAHAAADRLVREAQRQAEEATGAAARRVPPRGWASPGERGAARRRPTCRRCSGLLDGGARRASRPSSRSSSPRRCASCCSPCARCSTGTSSGSASPRRDARASRSRTSRWTDGPGTKDWTLLVAATIPAFRALPAEMQQAAGAAAALALTMLLPWYRVVLRRGAGAAAVGNLSAFGVFSFVEAAILLVAAGVLYLVWARSQQKAFHLPGGDGTVIMAAGGWAVLLLVWRLFDKPDVDDPADGRHPVGHLRRARGRRRAGRRRRAGAGRAPPGAAEPGGRGRRVGPPAARRAAPAARRPREAAAVTEALREPPGWEGEPPEAPRTGRGLATGAARRRRTSRPSRTTRTASSALPR